MWNRCVRSILAAFTFAVAAHGTATAAPPAFLVCLLEDRSELRMAVDNLGGMREAVHQCIFFWNGKPAHIER